MQQQLPLSLQIRRLHSRRNAKQNSIAKRIRYIIDIVDEHGSRTKLKSHTIHLERTFTETYIIHEELMPLLPEDSSEYADDLIEDLRLEIDLALSIVHEYLASRDGEPPSETSSIVESDDALSYQTSETFLDDDSCDKLGIDDNLKTDSVQEIVNKRSESLEEHGFPQLPPLSKRNWKMCQKR